MKTPPVTLARPGDRILKRLGRAHGREDIATVISAIDDVIKSRRKLNSQLSGHPTCQTDFQTWRHASLPQFVGAGPCWPRLIASSNIERPDPNGTKLRCFVVVPGVRQISGGVREREAIVAGDVGIEAILPERIQAAAAVDAA